MFFKCLFSLLYGIIKTHFYFIYIYTKFFRIGESFAITDLVEKLKSNFDIKIEKYMFFNKQRIYFIIYIINELSIYTYM